MITAIGTAFAGGGFWITDEDDGNSEFVIGQLTPEQEISVLKAENKELKEKINNLERHL